MSTVKIIPNQTFLHDRERYEVGKSYEVTEPEAFYFRQCGWLEGGEGGGSPTTADLKIHDGQIGHTAEVK